ncbi:MAG: ATPase [Dysgonamonadaceae bacterium]|jgi:N-acetylglucosamine kinase-like BadF-type ATPase|nr:ATPase [Dysgonamonadaceae bacterium]
MYLIADSGSTKTNWRLFDATESRNYSTIGLNPYFVGKEDFQKVLTENLPIKPELVDGISFYGSGCTPEKEPIVKAILDEHFGVDNSEVHSDLLAAARSLCKTEEGIACIVGTGSNSCYYDGKKIAKNVPALGFILGDEGSGAVLGRKLLSDVLKNQLPEEVRTKFFEKYPTSQAEIIENVYRKPAPNRYLAAFTPFLSENLDIPEIANLVEASFSEFIVRNILQYEKARQLPVHFTGSIAYYFRDNLANALNKFNLIPGHISREPLDGLKEYHREQLKDYNL